MVDPKEQSTKKSRLLVCSSHQTNREVLPKIEPPDQVMDMDTDKQEEQMSTSIVEEPTFWTMCEKCGVRYKYYTRVLDKQIKCRHCKQIFTAKDVPLSNNAGRGYSGVVTSTTQPGNISTTVQVSPSSESGFVPTVEHVLIPRMISTSPKNDFNSNGLDSQESKNQEAEKQGDEIQSDHNMTRLAFTGNELGDQTLVPRQLVGKLESAYDELFKQGLWMMIKGFFVRARAANAEDISDLLFYGRIIIRNFAELGITDPGFGALLDNLEKMAADVISQQSLASKWASTHALFVDLMKVAEYESSEAMALKTSLNEEAGDYEVQLDEAEASLTKAKKKEEKAKRERIEAEEEMERRKQKLKVVEQSMEKAELACKEKEDALAKAKEKVSKAEEEIEVSMGALKEKEAKWRSLCEPFPGLTDPSL